MKKDLKYFEINCDKCAHLTRDTDPDSPRIHIEDCTYLIFKKIAKHTEPEFEDLEICKKVY